MSTASILITNQEVSEGMSLGCLDFICIIFSSVSQESCLNCGTHKCGSVTNCVNTYGRVTPMGG